MKANSEDLIRLRHLAFVGRVTASLSHEIKNTLAIISESSGLMGDLLDYSAPPAEWAPYPRLKPLLATIAQQVERSGKLVKRLNRFAHSMDEQSVALELNELLGEVASIAQRLANLREVHLETNLANESLNMLSDPFRIQQVVFYIIEVSLKSAPRNSTLTLASRGNERSAQVVITDEAPSKAAWLTEQISSPLSSPEETGEESDPDLAVLGLTVAMLGGSIEAEDLHPQGNRVTVTFPLQDR